jgi:hypothetical protein
MRRDISTIKIIIVWLTYQLVLGSLSAGLIRLEHSNGASCSKAFNGGFTLVYSVILPIPYWMVIHESRMWCPEGKGKEETK